MMNQLVALSPQLIIAFAITMALLIIAMKRSERLIQAFTGVTLLFAVVISVILLNTEGVQVTPLILVDRLGVFAQLLIYLSSLMVISLSYKFLKYQTEVHDEYYVLILLAVLGASILVVADHFASLFLGFEILSISLVGLVGYCREGRLATETALKYLVLSAVASSFMLLGIAFIYGQTGLLGFADMRLTLAFDNGFYLAGLVLFSLGVLFKLALAPFHLWVADIYQGASTLITMFMATISKIAMIIVFLKVTRHIASYNTEIITNIMIFIAIASMIIGNVLALKQQNIKRLLAYSSVAHMGYALVVMVVAQNEPASSSLTDYANSSFAQHALVMYLCAYVLATLSIFYVIFQKNHQELDECYVELADYKGLFWRERPLAVLMLVSLLSLAGIPLTAGFIGKYYLFSHVMFIGQWTLLVGLVIGSGIGLFYYLQLAISLFDENEIVADSPNQNASVVVPLNYSFNLVVTLIIFGLALGILPDALMQVIAHI